MIDWLDPMANHSEMQEENAELASLDFAGSATRALRGILAQRRVTYAELVERLAAIGVSETEASVSQKVRRGTFQLGFFLQCMVALRIKELTLVAPDTHEEPTLRVKA